MIKTKLLIISFSATFVCLGCKQEPVYQLKEPFGEVTASAVDEWEEDTQEFVAIPKKFLNKDRLKEKERRDLFIQKKLKEARKFNPNDY